MRLKHINFLITNIIVLLRHIIFPHSKFIFVLRHAIFLLRHVMFILRPTISLFQHLARVFECVHERECVQMCVRTNECAKV